MIKYQDFDLCIDKLDRNQYRARATAATLSRTVEHSFALEMHTLKMREELRRLETLAISSEGIQGDFHVAFGQMLYRSALGGDAGALYATLRTEMRKRGEGVRLAMRVDENAPEMMNMPWELLHDGEDFLVTRAESPISRLPVGVERGSKPALGRTLRMLVIVSSPLDLPGPMILNTEKEQEVILAALDKLQCKRLIDIDFCEDACIPTIQDYLSEQEYDILHFTGHGVFNEEQGRGEILLEDEQGYQKAISNTDFAAILRNHPSLRLVVLSACQSARTANNTAYADMAGRLAVQGIPSVLAMQYSVLDTAAILFAGRFYTGLANNQPVDVALTEARLALRLAGTGKGGERIDFATPVLFLSDPECVTTAKFKAALTDAVPDSIYDFSTVSVMDKGFVGRQRELRRIRNGFASGRRRACILHGLGGMGKSVLATRAATKLHDSFRGVKAIRITAATRTEDILEDINGFLNLSGVSAFNQVIHASVPLAAKVGRLAQILNQLPYLVIFDNCEDMLTAYAAVRDGLPAANDVTHEIKDPTLAEFFEILIKTAARGSRFLFTSRYDFDPAKGRLTAEIEHISLAELTFPVAAQCMNNHDILASLDVVSASKANAAEAPAISKHELFRKIGGHPYTIDMFARRAAITSVADAWLEIQDIEREMIEFTLLDRIFSQLPAAAQALLLRASVLTDPPSLEMLEWLMSDAKGSPGLDAELGALLRYGMVSREENKDGTFYPMHMLVKSHAHGLLLASGADEQALWKRAAQYWKLEAERTDRPDAGVSFSLKARDYYYAAKEYDLAWQLVHAMIPPLMRWGATGLLFGLLSDSIKTTEGFSKGSAMYNQAILYHDMGDLDTALKTHQHLYELWKTYDDKERMAQARHEIALIHQERGEFARARASHIENIQMRKSLASPDLLQRHKLAMSIYSLALLDFDEGKFDSATANMQEYLRLASDLGDWKGVASAYRELGQIDFHFKRYGPAKKKVAESLKINEGITNKKGRAHCHVLLGKILREEGKTGEATVEIEKAAGLFDSMGMRLPLADCLYQLGMIHNAEGNYRECIDKCFMALSMFADAKSHSGQNVVFFLVELKKRLGPARFDALCGPADGSLPRLKAPRDSR